MISLTHIKSLLLAPSSLPNRHAHLSAASGLVQVGPWLYVVADDELHLGKFSLANNDVGELFRCFDGELPMDKEERKAAKPDIEVLTLIPAFNTSPHALLALGSGSKKNRHRGAIIPLDHSGNILGPANIIELSNFYEFLKKEIGKLNIEGAAIVQDDILLFQRGNKKNELNASIRLKLEDFYRAIQEPNYEPCIRITPYDLGEIDQVPLCFTDATSLPSGDIIFTASAENTSDSYLDGACMGSAVGVIDPKGKLSLLEPVNKKVKLEGIEATTNGSAIELLLVSDADDATLPAQLYSARINS
ncbi:hypothetical protein GCM10011613_16230 [Cellvibrio zantedeschiae]|uniref:Uncharacterized protein n=1 Tax=Cellvibrio zantedeschiae TaxID=1237077 RepID=A0ABQ3B012_9GAMM|nr:hypothetical protein [Cellvibrio zantedeschiae]GGY72047.1 hypothetical protein GCM10011613_16230 [Cellvibrio zantedeschiae]